VVKECQPYKVKPKSLQIIIAIDNWVEDASFAYYKKKGVRCLGLAS
jgi:hypothetical protein